jgi:hypothetical protein
MPASSAKLLPRRERRRTRAHHPRRRSQQIVPLKDPLLIGWRDLSPAQLAGRIRAIQRTATERHLPESTWRVVDAMRVQLRHQQRVDQRIRANR